MATSLESLADNILELELLGNKQKEEVLACILKCVNILTPMVRNNKFQIESIRAFDRSFNELVSRFGKYIKELQDCADVHSRRNFVQRASSRYALGACRNMTVSFASQWLEPEKMQEQMDALRRIKEKIKKFQTELSI